MTEQSAEVNRTDSVENTSSGPNIDRDWANLEKYRKENEKQIERKQNKKAIVLMGDSITEYWSPLSPEFFKKNNLINRGISGQTTPQMLIRFKQDAIHLNPGMIIINAGTNDIAGNTGPATIKMIIDNIFSMAEIARGNNIQIALSTILPVYRYPWPLDKIDAANIIPVINEKLDHYCKQNNLTFIDYFSPMVDHKKGLKIEYGEDGVHPNKAGYRLMEEVLRNSDLDIV